MILQVWIYLFHIVRSTRRVEYIPSSCRGDKMVSRRRSHKKLLTLRQIHLDPVLLKKKAINTRKTTGDNRWQAPLEKTNRSIAKTVGYALLRPFQLLIWESMCLSLNIYSAILLGVVYLFFGAFPLVFTTNHGFNLWQVGLSFTGLMIGMLAGGASFPVYATFRSFSFPVQDGVKS